MASSLRHARSLRWPEGALLLAFAVLAVEAALTLVLDRGQQLRLGDSSGYLVLAQNLFHHASFSVAASPPYAPSLGRVPGYPALIGAIQLVSGSEIAIRVVQFALIGAMAACVFRLAERTADRASAALAGLLTVTYLPLLWLARFPMSEVPATAVVVAAVLATAVVLTRRRTTPLALCAGMGAILGAATMLRAELGPLVLLLAALIAVWPGKDRGRAVAGGVLAIAVFGLCVAPWAIRNESLSHRFVPFGANGGVSLLASAEQYDGSLSYKLTTADWRKAIAEQNAIAAEAQRDEARRGGDVPLSVRSELRAEEIEKARARAIMKRQSVTHIVASLPERVAYMWSVADFPPERGSSAWHRLDQLQYALLLLFGALGTWVAWRARYRVLLALAATLVAYFTALHLVYHVEARYTMFPRPVLLVLPALGAGWAWARVRRRAGAEPGQRAVPAPSS
jgi:4-amino-4-deoxy-L-arabinose transferase-like glycosyltransferase